MHTDYRFPLYSAILLAAKKTEESPGNSTTDVIVNVKGKRATSLNKFWGDALGNETGNTLTTLDHVTSCLEGRNYTNRITRSRKWERMGLYVSNCPHIALV